MAGERVLVAMSGGVDSSVAAWLLKRQGYTVVGMTAELFGGAFAAGPCCGRAGREGAAAVCAILGVTHHSVDYSALFEQRVIARFISEYQAGRTPNPCADCNRFIKFDAFLDLADQLQAPYLATGHYARLVPGPGGLRLLCCATDTGKDQTYFLACMSGRARERVLFPLGGLRKEQVRATAAAAGLPTAQRKESQDICFLKNSIGISELLGWHTGSGPRQGCIVDEQGQVLGRHPGVEHFTIGQRKGLRLGGGSEGLVVHALHPATDTVVVAQRDAHPIARLELEEFTDLAPGLWEPDEVLQLRGRYRQALWPGRVTASAGTAGCVVEPLGGLYGMAVGQWCVGYREEAVVCGGIIRSITYTR